MESWYGFTEAGEVRRFKGVGASAWRSFAYLTFLYEADSESAADKMDQGTAEWAV